MAEYVGLDVSKEETRFCVVDEAGKITARGKALSDPGSLFAALREHTLCPERIVLETGTLSNWLARGIRGYGLPVDVLDARWAHAVLKLQRNKTDANDAALLAGIARTGFCPSVPVSSEASQEHRIVIKARRHLVNQRRDTQNAIRGFLSSLGLRFAKGSGKLASRVREVLTARPDLSPLIEPLLSSAATQAEAIKRLDREIKSRAKAIAVCRQLMTIPGVAHNTALAYVATIDEARRFAKSRDVGAYVGLTSRRHQSGEMDYSGRISKHGDALLRSLLYESANSLLTVVRKAHPLKDWARRIRRRSSHKKACVALARKLAVIMHRMMITGEAFRWPEGGERDAGGGLARSLTETSDHTDPRKRKRRPQPGRWPRRSRQFGCKPDRCPRVRVIPWEAEAKGHYDEASGPTAGNDFGDNRVPGKGQKAGSGGLDRETGIRQPTCTKNNSFDGPHRRARAAPCRYGRRRSVGRR